jgi:phage repressor protein C with HTH and peptisase S24 domain
LLLGSGFGGVDLEHKLDELIHIPKVLPRLNHDGEIFEKSPNIQSTYAFRHDWIRQKGDPSQMILMEVSGDFMSPEIKEGDTVLIDRYQTDIYVGKIYAVSIGKEITVRYVDRSPGKIILRSSNNSWNDIEVDIRDDFREPVNIIGRVVWWSRDVR